ncbi:hypothetical protein [Nocardia sp. NPDC019304]|uniref:hypothetical protein n=1 Tax=unclassified Nocardia TaxID=2637762 RepID=UPI0033D102DF
MFDILAGGKVAVTCVLVWWALVTSVVFLLAIGVYLFHPDPKRRRDAHRLLVFLRDSVRSLFRRERGEQ